MFVTYLGSETGQHIFLPILKTCRCHKKRGKNVQSGFDLSVAKFRSPRGYLTSLRLMDSQKAEKELGILHFWWFTLMAIFLWGNCFLQMSPVFNHSTFACFLLAQEVSFNKSFYFSFKKHALTSLRTQHCKQNGVPMIFLNKWTLEVLENLVFPKLFSVSTPWDGTHQPTNKMYVTFLEQVFFSWHWSQQ